MGNPKQPAVKTRAGRQEVNHRTLVGHARRERTRAKILESAMQVFAAKGADAPMIDDFIRAAGVARGTFYNYFRTTQELLDATISWSSDDVIRSIEAEVRTYLDPALRLATGCRLYLRLAESDRPWCEFMVQVPHVGVLARSRVRADLRSGLAAGSFQFETIEAAHDLVTGAMLQALHRLGSGKRPYANNAIIGMLLRGLGVAPSQITRLLSNPLPALRRRIKSEALFADSKLSNKVNGA